MSSKTAKEPAYKGKKKSEQGNTIYLYDEKHIEKRTDKKREHIQSLHEQFEKLNKKVKSDLKSKDEKTRLIALVVGLIDETYERVGNLESAKDGNFGVTGWQKQHVTFKGSKAVIKYVGKADVDQEKEVTDAGLVSALKEVCKGKKDKDWLFATEDSDNPLSGSDVNEYLSEFGITAKDIRGYHANILMVKRLEKARSGKLPSDKKEKEKKLKEEFEKVLEQVAEDVGHESATLKSQYLMPEIVDGYLEGGKINNPFEKCSSMTPDERKLMAKMVAATVRFESMKAQAEHLLRSASRTKTAGEVKFIKDNGPLSRAMPRSFKFDPKAMKSLAKVLWAGSVAMGHLHSAYAVFSKLKSVSFSPDGQMGGKGYIMPVKDVRSGLVNAIETLSSITDTIYDEIKADHWNPEALAPKDKQQVEKLVDESRKIQDDPESYVDEEADEHDVDGDDESFSDLPTDIGGQEEVAQMEGSEDSVQELNPLAKKSSKSRKKQASSVVLAYLSGEGTQDDRGGPVMNNREMGQGPYGSYNNNETEAYDWRSTHDKGETGWGSEVPGYSDNPPDVDGAE